VAVLGRRGAIALTCAAVLAMPAAALASAYDDTLRDYRTTGAVNGCKYTAQQLAQAKTLTPANIKDIAPGYPAQLAVAADKRAKGCSKAEEKAANTTTAAAGATTGTTATGTTATATTGTGAATQPPATTTIAPNVPTTAATPAPAPVPAPAPAATATQPAPKAAASHKAARLALIVVGALLVMLLALWAFARWWAWEPHWLARWRHATAEAGWRASAAWAEFTDWLRLGR
jgi:cobalamin biosynthesis Mg chelatase CobN